MKRRGTGTEARIKARAEERARVREEAARVREEPSAEDVEVIEDPEEPHSHSLDIASLEDGSGGFSVDETYTGGRLDQFLAAKLPGVSRARAQMLLEQSKVNVTGAGGTPIAASKIKANYRVSAGEHITVTGPPQPPPLRAVPEDIPLDILFEDADMAVVNKAAGMTVHAGAGAEPDDERGKGTLVNALLHHFRALSHADDAVRPGIVHRLDKQTSGTLVVAKNDTAHAELSSAFAERRTGKEYIALVHGHPERDSGTVNAPIARDQVRRTRMTTRSREGRSAVTHWKVQERLATPWGDFTLLDIRIETGRTHQIRVHMASVGHPVVGDTLYGAPEHIVARELRNQPVKKQRRVAKSHVAPLSLDRNFLHAARLTLPHPRSGKEVSFTAPLPHELESFLAQLRG